jgi:hypothetical protein
MANEASFQDKVGDNLRDSGCHVIKFHDEVTAGIPDLFVGADQVGFWLELKWAPEMPKRLATSLAGSITSPLTDQQRGRLTSLHRRPCLAGVLVGRPGGKWLIIPAPRIELMLKEKGWAILPWQEGPVSLKALCDAWKETAEWASR